MYSIEIHHLYKSFGEVKAVNDLSFRVKTGELFAFLGENGAGKSTTISVICSHLQKDAGEVLVCGENVEKASADAKKALGVVFQNSVLDGSLTVKECLQSRAALYGITGKAFGARLKELSELLDFSDLLNRVIGKLSGGQRRRIDIARALLHKPKILILDEPTTGLDPQTRKLLWDVISSLRQKENLTVFLTTHYMEEAAEADFVVILDHGQIVAEGTPLALKNAYTGDFVTIYDQDEEKVRSLGRPYTTVRDGFKISVENTAQATELIVKNPALFKDFEITKGKMDDVFLAATGKKMEGGEGK